MVTLFLSVFGQNYKVACLLISLCHSIRGSPFSLRLFVSNRKIIWPNCEGQATKFLMSGGAFFFLCQMETVGVMEKSVLLQLKNI